MAREFPVWVIVVLPWLGALICVLLARLGVRPLGPRRAALMGHYVGLGAAALSLMFAGQAIGHLLAPEDPRALAHTPLREWIEPLIIGDLRIDATLVADRLSTTAALLILVIAVLTRVFVPGPTGQTRLFGDPDEPDVVATGLRRLGLLGLLEGAALLFVLAGDLGLAALGWAILGIGGALVIARDVESERRASAATRVLALGVGADMWLGAAILALIAAGIGLAHNNLWAPLTGDYLYEVVELVDGGGAASGLAFGELIAVLLVGAAVLRLSTLAWTSNSLNEAVLDAVLIPGPAIYLLLRYQRVLSYAPTVLAGLLVLGIALALIASGVGLARPIGTTRWRARPGVELGLAGTGLGWVGLTTMAVGVGAWRTVVTLVLAQALTRIGLRLALLIAARGPLSTWTARVTRTLCWGAAGIAPGLGFVALAQVLIDVLTRTSLLAPWLSWLAAASVLLVAFSQAAAVARIWYEDLGRQPGAATPEDEDEDDGLDLAPLIACSLAVLVLGLMHLGAWFGVLDSPSAWLDKILPLAGGHESAPTGIQDRFRDGGQVGRPWVAGAAAMIALVTGFAWMWARDRFRRSTGGELGSIVAALEWILTPPRRIWRGLAVLGTGLSELAGRGLARGLFDEGPRILERLGRDSSYAIAPRLRGLSTAGTRMALLGVIAGFGLLLGWLYAKPEISSALPTDDYGFGGLRPKLIRAGGVGKDEGADKDARAPAAPAVPVTDNPGAVPPDQLPSPPPTSSRVAPTPISPTLPRPRADGAEPAPIVPLPDELPRESQP